MTRAPVLPQLLDSTMLTTWRSCPRKFFWEFCYNLSPVAKSADLHAGGCFAKALETFYEAFYVRQMDEEAALKRAFAAFTIAWGDYEPPPSKTKTWQTTWDAFTEYLKRWPPTSDNVRPFLQTGKPSYEFTFSIALDKETTGIDFPRHPSGDPFIFAGRYDTLGTMGHLLVIKDEKTMGQTPGTHWSEIQSMRGQFLGYVWSAQTLGLKVDTVVVRCIVILKTMTKTLEAVKRYPTFMVDRWVDQLHRDLGAIVQMWNEGHFSYNFGDSCSSYGGCTYLPLCTAQDPDSWMPTFSPRNWNPLHANPEEV